MICTKHTSYMSPYCDTCLGVHKFKKLEQKLKQETLRREEAESRLKEVFDNENINKDDYIKYVQRISLEHFNKYKD